MTETAPRLAYRPAECARLLGCSREMIFKLLEQGAIRGYRIGAARFVAADELARFVRERQEASG